MTKYYPEIGTKLYLSQRTGLEYVDLVKTPYTVVGKARGKLLVQECELVFNGPRYYDTLADEIRENPNGQILELSWPLRKRDGRLTSTRLVILLLLSSGRAGGTTRI